MLAAAGVRTILLCAHGDGVTGGPVAHLSAGQHPHAVFGPLRQLVQQDAPSGAVHRHHACLRVRLRAPHQLHLVVSQLAVAQLLLRRLPGDADGARAFSRGLHLLGRASRN